MVVDEIIYEQSEGHAGRERREQEHADEGPGIPNRNRCVAGQEYARVGHDGHRTGAAERFEHLACPSTYGCQIQRVGQGERRAESELCRQHVRAEREHGGAGPGKKQQCALRVFEVPQQACDGRRQHNETHDVDARL